MARLLTLLGITLLTFLLLHVVPADPARTVAGPKADRATIESIRREMALDAPWAEQYARYLLASAAAQAAGRRSQIEGRIREPRGEIQSLQAELGTLPR